MIKGIVTKEKGADIAKRKELGKHIGKLSNRIGKLGKHIGKLSNRIGKLSI